MAKRKSEIELQFSATNSDFKKSLSEMDKEIKDLNKSFALQKEQMRDSADESEKLSAKLENLKDKYAVGENKINEMRDALDNSIRVMGEGSKEAEYWKGKLQDAEIQQAKLANSIKDTDKAYKDAVDSMSGFGKKIEDLKGKSQDLEVELTDIEKALKMDPGNLDLLSQKQRNLTEQVETTAEALEEMRQKQAKLKDVDTKGYEKLGREIVLAEGKVKELTKEIDGAADASDSAAESAGGIGGAFKGILAGGAIANIASGVGEIAAQVGEVISEAMELSRNRAVVKFSMGLDDEGLADVQDAILAVEAYGLDAEEALSGVRKQFLLNKDASKEANEEIVKAAGFLAAAWGELDFNEVIQETNEIATQFEVSQTEALALVDALLKVGFPPDQLDIISEYGNQLKMAGYDAEGIQAIFKAGIDTGSWNIDNLLDGVKEGRIKLTEFATEIPNAVKPAIKSLGMTEAGFKDLAKEVAKGGDGGRKAYETVAKAVLNVEDKTEQAQAGTAFWGTLWEEQGTKVAETIANASDHVVSMKDNVDAMNKSIAGMDAEPAKKYAETMQELDKNLLPLKLSLADMANDALKVLNAAMEGTSVQSQDLESAIKEFVESGSEDFKKLGYTFADVGDGMITVSDKTGTNFRRLTEEELELWNARRVASFESTEELKENATSTGRIIEEGFVQAATAVEDSMDKVDEAVGTSGAYMEETLPGATQRLAEAAERDMAEAAKAMEDYAAKIGMKLPDAQKKIEELGRKYDLTSEQIVDAASEMGVSLTEFETLHSQKIGKINTDMDTYVSNATNGFSKIEQESSISLKKFIENMEYNAKATRDWSDNMNILMDAGVDKGVIEQLRAMGPAAATQTQKWVDELSKMNGGTLTEYENLKKGTKSYVDGLNETYVDSIEAAGDAARTAQELEEFQSVGGDTINDIKQGMIDNLPYLREEAEKTGKTIQEGTKKGINDSKESTKSAARDSANAAVNVMEDEFAKVPGKVEGEMKSARSDIKQQMNLIKDDMAGMKWKIPRPETPKWSLKGSLSLQTGSVPSIQTTWYKDGGYANKATLFGMGEAGGEGIVPLEGQHMYPFADAVAERITNTTNSTQIVINASISNEMDLEHVGRTIDRHLNTQSHEIKIVKGR